MTPLTFSTLTRIAGKHYRREPGIAANDHIDPYWARMIKPLTDQHGSPA